MSLFNIVLIFLGLFISVYSIVYDNDKDAIYHSSNHSRVVFEGPAVKNLFDALDKSKPVQCTSHSRCRVEELFDCGELDRTVCPSGIYNFKLDSSTEFDVYCEMDKYGGGWTVIQRRVDGRTAFYRDWETYKYGFGNLKEEFWLGNEKIHQLTKKGKYMLRVDLEDFENNLRFAQYENFFVYDEQSGYKLNVTTYSGNAGDSLGGHSGAKFSTFDVDNDADTRDTSCAQLYKGAWWYTSCHSSNLNGLYLKAKHDSFADGVNWRHWKGYNYSLKKTELKIKRMLG